MAHAVSESLARLRTFAQRPRAAAHAQCELCTARLDNEHEHVVERATGRIACCCGACALLFRTGDTTRYRTVPRDVTRLTGFRMTDAQWSNLAIPIGLAFLYVSSRAEGVIAVYPSPAGGTESHPMPEAWQELVTENPVLTELAPDVEALLVNRIDGARECYRVPINECYKLVGLVRRRWRGFTGGVALWHEIANFFTALQARCDRCSI
ncbi:MAG: DUF5947 family protein [Pirellulales bacterium]